jgi:hypothetical protein
MFKSGASKGDIKPAALRAGSSTSLHGGDAYAEGGSSHGGSAGSAASASASAPAAEKVYAGWLRTKGRDNGALVAAVAGNRIQQMKAWNLWWTVLSRGVAPAPPFTLRCYADEALTQLKARTRTRTHTHTHTHACPWVYGRGGRGRGGGARS